MFDPYASNINLLVNGTGTGGWNRYLGGSAWFECGGTFGGGTVTLEVMNEKTGAIAVITGVSLTANGSLKTDLPPNCMVRAAVAGATNPVLNATLKRIP